MLVPLAGHQEHFLQQQAEPQGQSAAAMAALVALALELLWEVVVAAEGGIPVAPEGMAETVAFLAAVVAAVVAAQLSEETAAMVLAAKCASIPTSSHDRTHRRFPNLPSLVLR